jgi:iron complex outermembrane receptor protein
LTQIRATFSYSKIDGGYGVDFQVMPGHRQLDGTYSHLPPFDTNEDNPNSVHGQIYLTALQIDHDLGFAKLENIVSYRDVSRFIVNFDDDITPLPLIGATENDPSRTYTEELRLLSPQGTGIQWVVGGYYINGKVAFDPLGLTGALVAPPPVELFERDSQKLWSVAPFGQATAEIFDKAFLTAGVRYNYEHLSTSGTSVDIPLAGQFIPGTPEEQTDRNTSWRGAFEYKWNSDLMTYVSASRGYKSGGYNLVNLVAGKEPPPYLPEKLTAYEAGLKAEMLDHRVAFNSSVYYYKYNNIQVQTAVPGGSVTSNGPLASLKGFDSDIDVAVTRHVKASAAINYVEGHYGRFPGALAYNSDPFAGSYVFDATGKSTIYTPRWSGNLAINYTLPTAVGQFDLNANASSTTQVYVAVTNRLTVPGYAVANSSVTWTAPNTRFSARLWVLNAFDREYVINRLETAEGDWQLWAPPRTYGASFTLSVGAR